MKKLKYVVLWATLNLFIPNNKVDLSTTAFCGTFNYQPIINGQPNPETPVQFTQRMVRIYFQNIIISYFGQQSGQIAQQNQQYQTTQDVAGIQ